ncbi:O-antigen ligase family protein [Clostridium sp. DL1XJH146]
MSRGRSLNYFDKPFIEQVKIYLLSLIVIIVAIIIGVKKIDFIGIDGAIIDHINTGTKYTYFNYYKALIIWIMAAVMFILVVYQYIRKQIEMNDDIKLRLPILLFILFIVLASFLSPFRYVSLWGYYDRCEGMFTYLGYMVLFIGAISCSIDLNKFKIYRNALIFTSIIVGLIGVFQFFGMNLLETKLLYNLTVPNSVRNKMPELIFKTKTRAYSTLYNPNYVGTFTSLLFPFFMVFYLYAREKRNVIIFFLSTCLMFTFMLSSVSRSGMVGSFIAFVVIIIIDRKNIFKRKIEYIILFISLIAIFIIMDIRSGGYVFSRMIDMLKDIGILVNFNNGNYAKDLEGVGTSRFLIWKYSLPMLKDTLLIGHGPDTFVFYFPHLLTAMAGYKEFVDKPHQMYLQIGINIGVLALTVFLWINGYVLSVSKKVIRKMRYDEDKLRIWIFALFVSIIGYLVQGLFNDSVVSCAPIFWINLGFLYKMSREYIDRY